MADHKPQGSGAGRSLRQPVAEMMEAAWREPGFCVPNQATYPHQWLWDSCFHALIWNELGSDRGLAELTAVLAKQGDDGFVPHMTYWHDPDVHADFWGRPVASSITQPPMYGHALAELARAGADLPVETVAKARRGLLHLAARPRTPAGLVPVFHPWETGCDDSARWDHWLPESIDQRAAGWRAVKGDLVGALRLSADGHAVGSDSFEVGSVGFNALVAWNARELSTVDPGGASELAAIADELTARIADRWTGDRWADDGPESGTARTLDAQLPLLVDPRRSAFEALVDPDAFGAPFGPRGMHRAEPSYEPAVYWRGPAWPQLGYLVLVAALRAEHESAAELANSLAAGARQSGLAEYWNPETGEGLGARPQSWAGLGLLAEVIAARLATD